MWSNPQFPADLVTFTEEILNGKLHFLCIDWRAFNFRDAGQYISCMWLLHFNLQSKVTPFQIFAGRISKEWPEFIKDNANISEINIIIAYTTNISFWNIGLMIASFK